MLEPEIAALDDGAVDHLGALWNQASCSSESPGMPWRRPGAADPRPRDSIPDRSERRGMAHDRAAFAEALRDGPAARVADARDLKRHLLCRDRRAALWRLPPNDLPAAFSVKIVVERTFAWFGRCRRLSRDFEASASTEVAWLLVAHLRLLTRRLARPSKCWLYFELDFKEGQGFGTGLDPISAK